MTADASQTISTLKANAASIGLLTSSASPFKGAVVASRLREAAEAVPGVESVESIELEIDQDTRRLTGSINIITTDGDYGRAELR